MDDDAGVNVANQAVTNGVPAPVVSGPLGQSNLRMILRYPNLGDATRRESVNDKREPGRGEVLSGGGVRIDCTD